MKVNLKTLIRFLSLDERIKENTLKNFDSYNDDQKFEVSRECWDTFYKMINLEVNKEFELAQEDLKVGKRDFQSTIYENIENQVYQRFIRDIRDQQESESLEDIRSGLHKILAAGTN